MMHYTSILFDLDGTLTDSKLGITKSIQYALKKYHIVVDDLKQLEPMVGPPLVDSFQELFGFSENEAKQAVSFYREYFKDTGIYENQLYAGIEKVLEQLVSQKRELYIATSKPTIYAKQILQYFKIDHYFAYICGSQLDGSMSDKTEIIRHVLHEKQLEKEKTVMIGDRKYDIIGARQNGIDSIALGYGYATEQEWAKYKPTYHVKTVEQLYEAFSSNGIH